MGDRPPRRRAWRRGKVAGVPYRRAFSLLAHSLSSSRFHGPSSITNLLFFFFLFHDAFVDYWPSLHRKTSLNSG